MLQNESEARFQLIAPVPHQNGYDDPKWIKLETPTPIEPTGLEASRRVRAGRTD